MSKDPLEEIVFTPELLASIKETLEEKLAEEKACEEKGHPHSKEISRSYFRERLEIGME